MKRKLVFVISVIGFIGALVSAYIFSLPHKAEPPAFNPAANPFDKGLYTNGIIESYQSSGANTNLYFEVSGSVNQIFVHEGEAVRKGTPLVAIDDSVQRRTTEQQKQQAAAALSLLQELKAQPRPETLAVSRAQVDLSLASLKLAQDQYDKQRRSSELKPGSVSRDALDNATNALQVARANLALTERQYNLTKAGAWSYDIANQEKQYKALSAAADASAALLAKYSLRAPGDGVVLAINASVGSYVSALGTYDTYTGGSDPVIVMGTPPETLAVRCYIDEILVHRLPAADKIKAEMTIRGTNVRVPLEFVRVQPYVSPKIQLSDQRQERVDVRVLPVIFRFAQKPELKIYPGQLVDVYIGQRQ
ncbi:MAG: biotin/lipoyl-binding protein [Thiobacillaceae bacterium]